MQKLKDYLKEIQQVKSRSPRTTKEIYQTRIDQVKVVKDLMFKEFKEVSDEHAEEAQTLLSTADKYIKDMQNIKAQIK